MKCNNCGHKIKDDFEFCPNCGAKIIRELVCSNCGTVNDVDASFCKKCGKSLKDEPQSSQDLQKSEPKTEAATSVVKTQHVGKSNYVMSIIATSLCLLSMVLIFSFLFVPFLSDNFLPNREYTMIHFMKQVFDEDISYLARNLRIIPILNVFICLVFFVGTGVVALVLIGISIPKLIKTISHKKYEDLTGKMMFLFSLFLVTFVYFIGFVINTERYYADSINGFIIFLLVFVGLTALFNVFYKEKFVKDSSVQYSILKMSLIAVQLAFIFAVSLLVGGNKYGLSIVTNSTITSEIVGNLGLIDQILCNTNYLTTQSITMASSTIIFSGVSYVLEVVALAFVVTLSLRVINSKRPYLIGLIFSAVALTIFVASTVFDIAASAYANQINSINYYGAIIRCNKIVGQIIAKIILSGLMLGAFITLYVLNKKEIID